MPIHDCERGLFLMTNDASLFILRFRIVSAVMIKATLIVYISAVLCYQLLEMCTKRRLPINSDNIDYEEVLIFILSIMSLKWYGLYLFEYRESSHSV